MGKCSCNADLKLACRYEADGDDGLCDGCRRDHPPKAKVCRAHRVRLDGGPYHTLPINVDYWDLVPCPGMAQCPGFSAPVSQPCKGFVPKQGYGNQRECGRCGVSLVAHPVVVQ